MKLLLAIITSLALTGTVYAETKVKEVCKDKKDKAGNIVKDKNGKAVQSCKQVKVHKKLEGTKVPEKK